MSRVRPARAAELIRTLGLQPHPEGGHYRELFRSASVVRPADARTPRHVVSAQWWQAAEPVGEFAYCAATVGPGFEFADFSFLRDDAAAAAALAALRSDLTRLR